MAKLVFSNLLSAEEWQAARWILVRDDGDRLFAYDGYPTLEEALKSEADAKVKFPCLNWSNYHVMEKDNLDGKMEIETAWVPSSPLKPAMSGSAT